MYQTNLFPGLTANVLTEIPAQFLSAKSDFSSPKTSHWTSGFWPLTTTLTITAHTHTQTTEMWFPAGSVEDMCRMLEGLKKWPSSALSKSPLCCVWEGYRAPESSCSQGGHAPGDSPLTQSCLFLESDVPWQPQPWPKVLPFWYVALFAFCRFTVTCSPNVGFRKLGFPRGNATSLLSLGAAESHPFTCSFNKQGLIWESGKKTSNHFPIPLCKPLEPWEQIHFPSHVLSS